jgi:hypothetical protein
MPATAGDMPELVSNRVGQLRFQAQNVGNGNTIVQDADPHLGLPEQWQAVLDAVEDACWSAGGDGATTGLIARRLGVLTGSRTPRTLLRVLRRRGYVETLAETEEGAPIRWRLTQAGRAVTTRRQRT